MGEKPLHSLQISLLFEIDDHSYQEQHHSQHRKEDVGYFFDWVCSAYLPGLGEQEEQRNYYAFHSII